MQSTNKKIIGSNYPILADKSILSSLGAPIETTDGEISMTVMTFGGWKFASFHSSIYSTSSLGHLSTSIDSQLNGSTSPSSNSSHQEDHIDINGFKLHLPPMIFGHDIMTISKIDNDDTNMLLEINLKADDAILCWARQHSKEFLERFPIDVIEVPYAHTWKAKVPDDIPAIEKTSSSSSAGLTNSNDTTFLAAIADKLKSWDWTFSSDYCFTQKRLEESESPKIVASKSNNPTNNGWQLEEESGIDTDMLRDTSEPIIFFDEMTLYQVPVPESELLDTSDYQINST